VELSGPTALFRGTLTVKVDEKGRLKLPAKLRERLAERYGAGTEFFITSLEGDKAFILPLQEVERIESILAQLPQFHKLKNKLLDAFNFWGAEAALDEQGRLLLPAKLREKAGLNGEVALVSHLSRIEVRNAARFEAEVQANPFTEEDHAGLAQWGI
jgi:MraZ protein